MHATPTAQMTAPLFFERNPCIPLLYETRANLSITRADLSIFLQLFTMKKTPHHKYGTGVYLREKSDEKNQSLLIDWIVFVNPTIKSRRSIFDDFINAEKLIPVACFNKCDPVGMV